MVRSGSNPVCVCEYIKTLQLSSTATSTRTSRGAVWMEECIVIMEVEVGNIVDVPSILTNVLNSRQILW